MFKIEIRSGKDSGHLYNFRVVIFQGRSQWNLGDGGEVLFFTYKEVPFQPVDTVIMLIMIVLGQLILDI